VGKVVVEAPQKTPLLFAKDFGSSFDHFENFPDRFEAAYRLELESFFYSAAGRQATLARAARCSGNASFGVGGCQKPAGKSPGTDLGDKSMSEVLHYLNTTGCVVRKSTRS